MNNKTFQLIKGGNSDEQRDFFLEYGIQNYGKLPLCEVGKLGRTEKAFREKTSGIQKG